MREFNLSDFQARTWSHKELVELGLENLERIIRLLRKVEKGEAHYIGYVRGSLEHLEGVNEETLSQAADLAIDHGALMSTLPFSGGTTTCLESSAIRYGHTTFLQCGGCEHACSWGQSVRCRFYSNLDGDKDGAPYDSPCRLKVSGECERVIKGLNEQLGKELKEQKEARQVTRSWIDRLLSAKREAESLPLIPVFRNNKSYLFGDRVLVWTGFPAFGKYQNKWAHATILRTDPGVAVVLDRPMLQHGAHARKYWIKKEWARSLWHTDLLCPFVLSSEEFTVLAQLSNDHALKKFWIACSDGWHIDDPTTQYSYDVQPDPAVFAATLDLSHVLKAAKPGRRMLDGAEALSMLGFTEEPTSAESVVVAYRSLKAGGKIPAPLLEQARNTALLRQYECTATGD